MKKFKLFNILILILLLTGSCKKFVEGYEKDPNGLLDTNDKQLFQGVLLENQFFLKGEGLRMAMIWLNQATGSDRQMVAFNNWNSVGNNQFNGPWGQVYTVIGEAKLLEDKATEINNIKLRGVAKLMRAWAGGTAASLWGDVPFSEAGQPDVTKNPAYDSMDQVFNQVQTLLDEAITDLSDPVGNIYDTKDIYFGGDASKWIKLAHGLKARFYLHAGDYANAEAEAAQGPASPDDDMYAQFGNYYAPSGTWNPTFSFYINREDYLSAQDSYGADLLMNGTRNNAKTDESIRGYYNYEPGSWWGTSYDFDLNVMAAQWTGADGKFGGKMELVTYGEMLLIQAEAEARTNGVAAALPYYNQYRTLLDNDNYTGHWGPDAFGVPAPFNMYLPYDVADFQAGGIENQDNIPEKEAFLRELFEERYVFFIGDYEAFVDFERSNNDADVPQYFNLKSGFSGKPLRFIYPQSEIDANSNFPGTAPAVTEPLPMYQ